MPRLFTPRMKETNERIKISILEENPLPRGKIAAGQVTDAETGKKYKVKSASCGLPRCLCDAVIYGYKK